MVLDSVVLSAPMVQCEVPDGSFMAVTDDTLGFYARDLATVFLSGPLLEPMVVERVERFRGK
jgi:preprotein translocase subunit SecD